MIAESCGSIDDNYERIWLIIRQMRDIIRNVKILVIAIMGSSIYTKFSWIKYRVRYILWNG